MTISALKALVGFLLLFVLPPLLLQPLRPALVALPLPEPTLWQSFGLFLGQILVFTVAVWGWNQRQRVKELERELARAKYTRGMTDD
jgi:hypothetical protein